MTIRIGANPIGWSNDDMQEIGGWIPLEQCLSEAKEAGFEGMELGNKFPREAAKLKPILDRFGLSLRRRLAFDLPARARRRDRVQGSGRASQTAEGHGDGCLHRRRMHAHGSWRPHQALVGSARS